MKNVKEVEAAIETLEEQKAEYQATLDNTTDPILSESMEIAIRASDSMIAANVEIIRLFKEDDIPITAYIVPS